ncbi:MAG TPA: M48 family metalloprotease, partial [Gaiellales bacterium]|nr:M48 family metalloprotease [Gaiellales bacterium]
MARRRTLDRDRGLAARMTGTIFLLGLVYVVFFGVLATVFRLNLALVIVLAAVLLIVQYWGSERIALATSGAHIVGADQQPELHAAIQRLCITADLPMPRVALIDSDMPNAFATGRSPRHAAVAVTTGLLRRLEPRE